MNLTLLYKLMGWCRHEWVVGGVYGKIETCLLCGEHRTNWGEDHPHDGNTMVEIRQVIEDLGYWEDFSEYCLNLYVDEYKSDFVVADYTAWFTLLPNFYKNVFGWLELKEQEGGVNGKNVKKRECDFIH